MKEIIYLAMCNTIDGRGKPSEAFASLDESTRDDFIKNSKNKPWLFPEEKIIDLDELAKNIWDSLQPSGQLALARVNCVLWSKDFEFKRISEKDVL